MTTFEKIMRAQFEAWRGLMDADGEHQHDLQAFESLGPRERRFAINMARCCVEAMKELPDNILAAIRYDIYAPDYREQTNDMFDAILAEAPKE